MSEIHTYVPGDNGCQARVRVPSMVGSRPSTTSMWCGLPERSPYHATPSNSREAETTHADDEVCQLPTCERCAWRGVGYMTERGVSRG